ncbi:MAG TPA: DUF4377 domain-containing protein [Polyangiaceae bacterium]|jgi:hypothetical protein|nr:DUF4377 domain-containing protein [Polyangiaceae bacterium]
MSHLVQALALLLLLSCSGSKPAEPPVASPASEPAAEEPGADPAPPSSNPEAPAAQADTKTLFVAAAQADCQGEAPQKCLQVRESETEPYRNLYSNIEGFDYEPSYVYELRVEAIPVPNAPADASSVRYRLLEVVSKRKAPDANSN